MKKKAKGKADGKAQAKGPVKKGKKEPWDPAKMKKSSC
jgi:hypothetical protein